MVVSDTTLKQWIHKRIVILDGCAEKAIGAAYELTAGKIHAAGSGATLADWVMPARGSSDNIYVDPGQMIWVRAKESVALPLDVCAFWWQTHTLSKKGLMLVNASMVPPGYSGHLACLFVNFGDRRIALNRDQTVSKLIFLQLDKPAEYQPPPFQDVNAYDASIYEVALSLPFSFMRVVDLQQTIKDERQAALDDITRVAKEKENAFVESATALTGVGFWLKASVLGAVTLALLTVVVTFVPKVQELISPNLDESIQAKVSSEVSRRMVLGASPSMAPEVADLVKQIEQLNSRLDQMQKSGPAPKGSPP